MRPRRVLLVTAVTAALATGCSSGAGPAAGTAGTTTSQSMTAPLSTTAARPAAPAASSAAVNEDGAVAFFRAQETVCRTHAEETGNSVVAADRFAGARQVSDLGGGAYLIEDGQGTRLVVKPGKGVVLPESGNPTDELPSEYSFGCPENVFLGTIS